MSNEHEQSLIYPLCKRRRCRRAPWGSLQTSVWEENALLQETANSLLPGRLPTSFARFNAEGQRGIPRKWTLVDLHKLGSEPRRSLLFGCLYFNMFLTCQTSVWMLALPTMSPWSNYQNCLSSIVWKKCMAWHSNQQLIEYESDFQTVNLTSSVSCYYYRNYLPSISTNWILIFVND